MTRLLQLLAVALTLAAPAAAHAIALVIQVHFETFEEGGQQPYEANLVGWRVELRQPSGAVVANLVTGETGETAPVEVAAGSYVVVLAPPDPYPYDPGATWPTNPTFPFTVPATNPQGQPISSYRLRIGLGCTCNDGDICTTDVCTAGVCSTRPNLRPEVPEICDGVDNDCDGLTDEGLPVPCSGNPPLVVGCADGTREGFLDHALYPAIAACGGAFTVPGLDGPPTCSRLAGNHATNRPGTGCSAADLCGAGWHVCSGPADVLARTGARGCRDAVDPLYASFGVPPFGPDADGDPLAPPPGGAFFATRASTSGSTCGEVLVGTGPSPGEVLGCGNLGLASSSCPPLDRLAGPLCAGLADLFDDPVDNPATDWGYAAPEDWAWQCQTTSGSERLSIFKRFSDRQGGVLCCRDALAGLPEVCDGIDNDLDGQTDVSAEGLRVGATCPLPPLCGTVECANDGTFACVDPLPCVDDTCDGVDDDGNGLTDDAYVERDTTCGLGVCASEGRLVCDEGDELDTCTPGYREEDLDTTCDGRDGDCDGSTDEDFVVTPTSCGLGACASTGQLLCESGVPRDTCAPKPPLSTNDPTCNGIDEDCDGTPDDDWVETPTACGRGYCVSTGVLACIGGRPTNTCVPRAPLAELDTTCDGVDDDCDGSTDEDYVPAETTCGEGLCRTTGELLCQGRALVDTCVPLAPTFDTDPTCDGVDEDCDGVPDDDHVGEPTACGVGSCRREGAFICVEAELVDGCVPGEPALDDATCDGADDDCDGETDEDFSPFASTCGLGVCAGQVGLVTCADGAPSDSCDPFAGASSELCNGLDDDCDGETDEDFPGLGEPCDGPDEDLCQTGVLTCAEDGTAAVCIESDPGRVELCNGLDDDCDGETDEGLSDCPDTDGDGWPDRVDNCPWTANRDQSDLDGDGVGDACDVLLQSGGGGCSSASGSPWGLFGGLALFALALAHTSRRRPRRGG